MQITLAKAKALNAQEDEVAAVDDVAIVQVALDSGRLADVLVSLRLTVKRFVEHVNGLPDGTLDGDGFQQYRIVQMLPKFVAATDGETDKAITRWVAGLRCTQKSMADSFPEDWKEKAVDSFDSDWVKDTLLKPATVSSLSTDFINLKIWITSLDKYELLKVKLMELDPDLLGDVEKTIEDCKQIVAVVLAYNTLFAKFAACTSAEGRRQCVKDLKKKLVSKKVTCPEVVMARIQSATSSSSSSEPAKKKARKS